MLPHRVSLYQFPVTTNAWGGGTVTTEYPLSGEVIEVRLPNNGTALTGGGTADFTITRTVDGGTILAAANVAAPFTYYPRGAVVTTGAGTTAYQVGGQSVYDTGAGVPVDGYVQVEIAQGSVSGAATLYMYYR